MRLRIAWFIAFFQLAFILSSCTDPLSVAPTPTLTEPPPTAQVVSYIDVLRNSEEYDGQFISVAGQISAFKSKGSYTFYFYDGLGTSHGCQKFIVYADKAAYESNFQDPLSVGDYVIVEGVWKASTSSYSDSRLTSAVIVGTGDEAQERTAEALSAWDREKQDFSRTLPILDYFDVITNYTEYHNQYIRIVGQVYLPKTTFDSGDVYFRFRGSKDSSIDHIYINLQGCPREMQDICVEGEYVVVTGIASTSVSRISLHDCYIEISGEEAKEVYEAIMPNHPASLPSSEPAPEQSQTASRQYVGSVDSDKFHYPSCRWATRISAENEIWFDSRDEAMARGYYPCGTCNP